MNTTLIVETTSLVKPWLMYLDSLIPRSYPEDLAIRLYNVITEDDYGAWDDFMAETDVLIEDDDYEEFTNAMSNILIDPVNSYFANDGLEVVCIRDSKVVRTLNSDFMVYSTIDVKVLL